MLAVWGLVVVEEVKEGEVVVDFMGFVPVMNGLLETYSAFTRVCKPLLWRRVNPSGWSGAVMPSPACAPVKEAVSISNALRKLSLFAIRFFFSKLARRVVAAAGLTRRDATKVDGLGFRGVTPGSLVGKTIGVMSL